MITHSPETPMPEPYKTYIHQRAGKISETLSPIVGDMDTQLCTRAITPSEQLYPDGLTYGCVVSGADYGLKSALYSNDRENGIHARSLSEAVSYAIGLFAGDARVRVKDPTESDGSGQYSVSDAGELEDVIASMSTFRENGVVLMPHLEIIKDRYTTGRINLNGKGQFAYVGREYVGSHDQREVFMGGDIAVYSVLDREAEQMALRKMDIPRNIHAMSRRALDQCIANMEYAGRVSVDTVTGVTDSGNSISAVIDLTPRVGGHTPAEALAIAALSGSSARVAFSSGRLYYEPTSSEHVNGTRFVDTDTLVIAAEVTNTLG